MINSTSGPLHDLSSVIVLKKVITLNCTHLNTFFILCKKKKNVYFILKYIFPYISVDLSSLTVTPKTALFAIRLLSSTCWSAKHKGFPWSLELSHRAALLFKLLTPRNVYRHWKTWFHLKNNGSFYEPSQQLHTVSTVHLRFSDVHPSCLHTDNEEGNSFAG